MAYQDFPFAGCSFFKQQELDLAAGGRFVAEDAGGDYLGIVEYEHVGSPEIVNNIEDRFVLDQARIAMEHHHARQLAPFRRVLGDELRGQIIVEQVGFHLIASKTAEGYVTAEGNKDETEQDLYP